MVPAPGRGPQWPRRCGLPVCDGGWPSSAPGRRLPKQRRPAPAADVLADWLGRTNASGTSVVGVRAGEGRGADCRLARCSRRRRLVPRRQYVSAGAAAVVGDAAPPGASGGALRAIGVEQAGMVLELRRLCRARHVVDGQSGCIAARAGHDLGSRAARPTRAFVLRRDGQYQSLSHLYRRFRHQLGYGAHHLGAGA
jgi:hypothetical protein